MALLVTVAVVVAATPVAAQLQTGNLYGTVKDQNGAVLPGVTITLTGQGAPQIQVTNAQGQFRFLGLVARQLRHQGRARGLLDRRLPEHRRSTSAATPRSR